MLRNVITTLIMMALLASQVQAFKIKPVATEADGTVIELESEGRLWDSLYPIFVNKFTQPVHESITNQIFGCTGNDESCSNSDGSFAPKDVLAGAQWNDNPPFKLDKGGDKIDCPKDTTIKLPRQTACWYGLFKHAEKNANKNFYDAKSGNVILYRIHFGDMQFVHSMASKDNIPAKDTYKDIMAWAEFTYKVAHGDISRGTDLGSTGIKRIDELLDGKGLTVQLLFARGAAEFQNDQSIQGMAFGSLLHMIEDSFSPSHTSRNDPLGKQCPGNIDQPGKVKSFNSYVNQNKKKHSQADILSIVNRSKAENGANVVYIGKALRNLYMSKKPWDDVRPFIECIYAMENPDKFSGPGDGLEL